MKAPATATLSPNAAPAPTLTAGQDPVWFIFTTGGAGYCVEAITVTKAVAKWRKLHPRAQPTEILAVVRGHEGELSGPIRNTPIYGVVVCLQDAGSKPR